jgi:hypothetical protein
LPITIAHPLFQSKVHAGIIGNEHDALARKSATTSSNIADTSIRTAGPEGNPFYNIYWLTKEDTEHQTQTHNQAHTATFGLQLGIL